MAYELKKVEEIRNSILNNMQNQLSKIEGSYNFDIASAEAEEIKGIYDKVLDLRKQMFPFTVDKEPYLTYWLETFGLKRKSATKATGTINIYGTEGYVVPMGTIVISRLGVKFKTLSNCLIGVSGVGTCSIESLEGGSSGNTASGDITGFEIMNSNILSVFNEDPITGGAEIESVESCWERMREKASIPNHSGNKNQYKIWCKEVEGVGKVEVVGAGEHSVPAGHVEIYIGSADNQLASPELVQSVKDYLNVNDRIPIGASVNVSSFEELQLNIHFDKVTVRKGDITKDEWINQFKAQMKLALNTDDFVFNDFITYPKVSIIAYGVKGTKIFDNMTLNGVVGNIAINYNQLPILNEVTITTFEEVI